MHDTNPNTDLMYQSKFFRQRNQAFVIFGDFAGEFDDECLAFEALDVRQRLAQQIKSQLIAHFSSVGHVFGLWSLVLIFDLKSRIWNLRSLGLCTITRNYSDSSFAKIAF